MKKDYFKYNNGKIEYEKSLWDKLKETFAYMKENKKLPPNESLLSIFYYANPSKVFSVRNIIKGLLAATIIATIVLCVHTLRINPSIVLPSQNNGNVNTPTRSDIDMVNASLTTIEQTELEFYQNYLDGKTAGIYAKKSAHKFADYKKSMLAEVAKDPSLYASVVETINLSISFSESLVSAISSYDNLLIKEIISTKY